MRNLSTKVVPLITDPDDTIAETALYTLMLIGPSVDPQVVKRLLTYLEDAEGPLPNTTLVVLAGLGSKARPALSFLLRELKGRETKLIRSLLIRALGTAGFESREAHDLLILLIEEGLRQVSSNSEESAESDRNMPELEESLSALGAVKVVSPIAIKILTRALTLKEPFARYRAAQALTQLDPENEKALSILIELLASNDEHSRSAAAFALMDHKHASKALPELRRLAESKAIDESEQLDYVEIIQIIEEEHKK